MVTTILAVIAVILLLVVVVLLLRRGRAPEGGGVSLLQQQLDALRQQTSNDLAANARSVTQATDNMTSQVNSRLAELDRRMSDNTGQVNTRLDNAARVVQTVSTGLGELREAAGQIRDIGKDISSLQDILRAPKLRGEIGELFLEDLLRQVVPNSYEIQHQFLSGEKVDAVVRLGAKLIPIDSKFPLENFKRLLAATDDVQRKAARRQFVADVRKHVDAIADKYIKPDEGTFDFALMYILAESVYYETVIRPGPDEKSIGSYAISRRVVPVSPNTLYANLQTIALGLRGFQVEKQATVIIEHLSRLQADFGRFQEEFDVLGNHLKNARNKYDDASKRLDHFQDKLTQGPALAPPESASLPGRKE
jgi:DNA recombination protein RmuC